MVPVSRRRREVTVNRVPRAVIGLALVALVLLLPGTAQASGQNPVCETAALLVQQGKPRQADAKIRAASLIGECAAELASARDQMTLAANIAEKARAELAVKRWAEASTWAASALTLDTDNELAKTVAASAKQAATAEAAQQADLAAEGKSQLQKLLDQWNTFYEEQLSPLASLLLPFLAILAALLVAARLLVLLVPAWQEADDRSGRVWRHWIVIAGAASLVIGAALVSVGASDVVTAPLSSATALVLLTLAVAAGVGAYLLGELAYRRGEGAPGRSEDARSWPTPISLTAVGIGLFAVGAVALLARLSGGDTFPSWMDAWGVIILGVVVAALGVVLTAWWLATRLRLNITLTDATGDDNKTAAALVAAYLNELGAEPPKGLEVPRGTDATALNDAFATLPDNAVLKAVKSFISDLAGVTPWTAAIDAGDRFVAVTLRRNARAIASAIIDPQSLGLTKQAATPTAASTASSAEGVSTDETASKAESTADTFRMAAAFVLSTMATKHPSIRRGLAGATDWKSLGHHYIASTLPSGKETRARATELLARALNEDPDNRLARLAFRHAVDREATDSKTIVAYAQYLAETRADLSAHSSDFDIDSLVLRVLYVRALVLVNAVYAHHSEAVAGLRPPDPAKETELQDLAKAALHELDDEIARGHSSTDVDRLRHFRAQFSDDIQGAKYLIGLINTPPSSVTPIGMYNLGATYASRIDVTWPNGVPAQGSDDVEAVTLFALACKDPGNREWISNDPQLSGFRTRTAYQNEFLTDPRTDFFELSPVKPYASGLKSSGFGQVSLISRAQPSELALATATASPTVRRQLVELALLHTSLTGYRVVDLEELALEMIQLLLGTAAGLPDADPTEAPLGGWEVEILDQLLQRGIATTSALGSLGPQRAKLATEMAKEVLKTCKPGTGQTAETKENMLAAHIAAWSLTV